MKAQSILLLALLLVTALGAATNVMVESPRTQSFSIVPEGHDWGQVNPGVDWPQDFAITNTGDEEINIDLDIWNDYEFNFMLDAPELPYSLAPGESYEFAVQFCTYDMEPQFRTAWLNVEDNYNGRTTHSYLLQAEVSGDYVCYAFINDAEVIGQDVTIFWWEGCLVGLRTENKQRSLDSYMIYFDGNLLDTIDVDPWGWQFEFTHYDVPAGSHIYEVQGVYGSSLGPMSNAWEVYVETPPYFYLEFSNWFGYVPLGTCETNEATIYNCGGGVITINPDDIQIINDEHNAYSFDAPGLPAFVSSEQPYTFWITFQPQVTEVDCWQEAVLTVQDNLGPELHIYELYGMGTDGYIDYAYIVNATVEENDVTLYIRYDSPLCEAIKTRSAVLGFNLYRDSELLCYIPYYWEWETQYTDYDVSFGEHNYAAQCVLAGGVGNISDPYFITVDYTEIATPMLDVSNGSLNLGWESIPGVEWYGIYAADDPYGQWTCLGYVNANFIGVNLSLDQKKFYRITAGAGSPPLSIRLEGLPAK